VCYISIKSFFTSEHLVGSLCKIGVAVTQAVAAALAAAPEQGLLVTQIVVPC
jgi:hypothetical protein